MGMTNIHAIVTDKLAIEENIFQYNYIEMNQTRKDTSRRFCRYTKVYGV